MRDTQSDSMQPGHSDQSTVALTPGVSGVLPGGWSPVTGDGDADQGHRV